MNGQPSTQDAEKPLARQNGVEVAERHHDGAQDDKQTTTPATLGTGGRSVGPHSSGIAAPALPRRPSIPSVPTPASQADSWRSKAAPMTVTSISSRPPQPSTSPPAIRGSLPPTTKLPELDLSVKPDENIEIVDFCDLEKLMDPPTSPEVPTASIDHAPTSLFRSRRSVASDFFDDRPVEHPSNRTHHQPSWRQPSSMSMSAAAGEGLRTQTMPIFADDELPPTQDAASNGEVKSPHSPTIATQPFKRHPSQGDQTSSSSTSQSTYISPAMLALRSPRMASHFKEAPMSTLTDTMSRIKGALDGMQSQDLSNAVIPRETNDKSPKSRAPATSLPKTKLNETFAVSWREQRESRLDVSPQVSTILSPPLVRTVPKEVFDVTRLALPRSPKPAWNAFAVKLPKESRHRDAISRKQLHFWNLPYPAVRWDILSWDPPVEGMNKRELSRDEIFHRKHTMKGGGKHRVLLPNRQIVKSTALESDTPPESLNPTSRNALVTAAGVKIKLPTGNSSIRGNAVIPVRAALFDFPPESSVPSWRRSANPVTALQKYRPKNTAMSNNSVDQLNTTSRSPPPEPSTPLPQFTKPKSSTPPRPSSAHSATVSLPTIIPYDSKSLLSRRPSGRDVAFFRTSRGDPATDSNKPFPRFTVTSELDAGEVADPNPLKQHAAVKASDESAQSAANSMIGRSPKGPPETFLPRNMDTNKPENKDSDDSVSSGPEVDDSVLEG